MATTFSLARVVCCCPKESDGRFRRKNNEGEIKRFRSCRVNNNLSTLVMVGRSSEERVYEVVLKQAALVRHLDFKTTSSSHYDMSSSWDLLNEAYDQCGEVCAEYANTFYLGTLLMTPERRRAVWAIYVWCKRTDELVDGPNASHITPEALDRWETRLNDLFQGRPYDMYDAALSDTVSTYPVDIQVPTHDKAPILILACT